MERTEQSDLLREVEIRVATLARNYKGLQRQLNSVKVERDELLEKRSELQSRVETLEQKLSVMALATKGDEGSRKALDHLDNELSDLLNTVESCIALLDTKLGNDMKG